MRNYLLYLLTAVLSLTGGTLSASAQTVTTKVDSVGTRTTFNPTNPPEPEENVYYRINVSAAESDAAYCSGTGRYLTGTQVTIRYSLRNSGYRFTHWTRNGEVYTESAAFTYTVGETDDDFVAHFDFIPDSPDEPYTINQYRLYLVGDPAEACSFNRTSGAKADYDAYVTVEAYANQSYVFKGWYDGATYVSGSTSFNYLMPDRHATLTARFVYNPTSPAEPESDGTQTNVQTTATGDVNKDGEINVLDVTAVIARSLDAEATELGLYDVNHDGEVNVLDVTKIIELSLQQ